LKNKLQISILVHFLLFLLYGCKTKNAASDKIVEIEFQIRLTQSSTYCGGARPTEEVLEWHRQEKPLQGQTIYIRQGKTNDLSSKIIAQYTSDENGLIRAKLAPGEYIFIHDEKKDSTYFNSLLNTYSKDTQDRKKINKTCLEDWLQEPLMTFEIKKGSNNDLHYNFTRRCSWNNIPCSQYTGPLPP
jgi:hypothetical protein